MNSQKKSPNNSFKKSLFKVSALVCCVVLTPTLNHLAVADSNLPKDFNEIDSDVFKQSVNDSKSAQSEVKAFLQSLDYNRDESAEIVLRNLENIKIASRAYNVPDWMIATIIYVETAQGIPGAWRWNDSASRDLFVTIGRPTSMGIMQVQQSPDDIGLENHWQRMMFAQSYQEDEAIQILDGASHLRQVLEQKNRLYTQSPREFQWSHHKLAVIAHEYNTGPRNWKGTSWEEAKPLDYGELFVKFLPQAYKALYGEDLTHWPLLEVPEELLIQELPQ